MAEAGLLAGLELVVRLVLVLVHVLQEVRLQGRREWMKKIGVDHNTPLLGQAFHRLSSPYLPRTAHCCPLPVACVSQVFACARVRMLPE